jgi:hypothetical protein
MQNKTLPNLRKFFFTKNLIRWYRNKKRIKFNNKHFIWLWKFIKLYSFCHPHLSYIKYISKFKYFHSDLQFHNGSKNYYFFEYVPILNIIEDDLLMNISQKNNNLIDHAFFNYNHKSFFKLNLKFAFYNLRYYFRFKYLRFLTRRKIRRIGYLWDHLKAKGYFYFYNLPILKWWQKKLKKKYRPFKIYNRYRISLKGIHNFVKIGKNKTLQLDFADHYWKYTKKSFKYPDFFYFALKKKHRNYQLIINDYNFKGSTDYPRVIVSYFYTLRFFFLYQSYFKTLDWSRYLQPKSLGKTYTSKKKIYYWT